MILLRTLLSMVSATASLLPFSFPRRLATASTMSVFAISSSKPMCSAERDRTRISERPLVFRSAGAVVPAQPARHLLRLHVHRLEVELAVEVHNNDAVAALFALVIMDLSRRLRPHGSHPGRTPNVRGRGELLRRSALNCVSEENRASPNESADPEQ